MLTEPKAYSRRQVDEFMERVIDELSKDDVKINEFRGMVHPFNNPQLTLWLAQATILNRLQQFKQMEDIAASKGEKVDPANSRSMLTDIKNLLLKILSQLDFKMESRWYQKLGDVANDFANICLATA